MKSTYLLIAIAALVRPVDAVTNDAATAQIEIARFWGNRTAAVSYTFDDGTLGHYTVAAPTLEEYGFRGTFGVVVRKTADDPDAAQKLAGTNAVRRISWQEWREMAARGHEVCNHGMEHKGLTSLDDAGLVREVNEAARIITEKVARPLTFIYPGNARNPKVREFVLAHHIAARDREERFGGTGFTVEKANAIIDKAIKAGQPVIIMSHAVAEAGYQPITREQLDGHLRYVTTVTNQVWVDTLAQVSRYVRERDAAKVTLLTQEANRLTFTLSCTLDPKLFNKALTCVITPAGRTAPSSASCEQGGVPIPSVVSGGKVLVDVTPSSGPVTVRWTNP